MRFVATVATALMALAFAVPLSSDANAAELKVVASVGVKAMLQQLAQEFTAKSGHKIDLEFGTAIPLKRQIDGGEAFDVTILTPPLIADLVKQGKVAAGSVADVARIGVAMAIRKGSAKPDISTAQALKATLLAAKSITYAKEGQSGVIMAGVVEKLGLTEALKAKTILETRSGHAPVSTVDGTAELAFGLLSEVVAVPGAEVGGMLPGDLQSYTVFTAGIGSAARDAAAAKAFIDFLKAPAALPTFKATGLEPV